MSDEILSLDPNSRNVTGGVSNDANLDIIQLRLDPTTKRLLVDSSGAPTPPVVDSYAHVAINLAAGTNQSLVAAPGASKQIWVYGVGFTLSVAGTVSFQDEDDTAITGIMPFAANGGLTNAPSGNFAMPMWKVATNKALEVDVVTADMDGWLAYAIVSV